MPENGNPKYTIDPETFRRIQDMVELKNAQLNINGFTPTDAIGRSLAITSMIDSVIPEGGRIIIRDDDGNETPLVII